MFNIFKSKKRRQLEIMVEAAYRHNEMATMKEEMLKRDNLSEMELDTLRMLDESMLIISEMPAINKLIEKQSDELAIMFRDLGL